MRTKHFHRLKIIAGFLSFVCLTGPFIYYFFKALVADVSITNKITFGFVALSAIIISVVNIMLKSHLRSPFWLMLLGFTLIFMQIKNIIVVMAITSLADELIFSPLYKYAREKYSINREIDKRGR